LAIAAFTWQSLPARIALTAFAGALITARTVRRRRLRRSALARASARGVRIGTDLRTGAGVVISDHQLSAHGLILGASGAGKSTTLLTILGDQIDRGRAVVAIDMKGSPAFSRELEDAAGRAGRPFKRWTLDGPGYWNPLGHGNATELKDKLISTERFTEPHYQRAAERYVQTILQLLERVHPERPPTLEEVVDLMDPRRLARMLRGIDGQFADRVQDYVVSLSADQLSAVRGLGTRLAVVSESHTGAYLTEGGPGTIDLRRALDGPEVVLFSLNSSTYGRLAAQVGTMVVQDLIAAAGHRLSTDQAAESIIAIDEFSALDSDNLTALLARGRESGVPVLLATQEFADLERAGRGVRDQVTGVTALKIAHRQDVPSSARMVAEMVGTERVWEQTVTTARHPFLGSYATGRGTQREVERFVIEPNEIQSLRTGEAVVITKLPVTRAATVRVTPRHEREGPER
jgi:hypothetical protein